MIPLYTGAFAALSSLSVPPKPLYFVHLAQCVSFLHCVGTPLQVERALDDCCLRERVPQPVASDGAHEESRYRASICFMSLLFQGLVKALCGAILSQSTANLSTDYWEQVVSAGVSKTLQEMGLLDPLNRLHPILLDVLTTESRRFLHKQRDHRFHQNELCATNVISNGLVGLCSIYRVLC